MIDSASALTPLCVKSLLRGSGNRYPLFLGGSLLGGVVLEERVVDLPGNEALQTTDDVLLGQSLRRAPRQVVDRRLMPAEPHDHDAVERSVGLPVAATVETMSMRHAARRGDRTRPTQLREGRLGSDPPGIVAGDDEQLRGRVGPDA